MAVLMINGPTIPAGEALSTALDCSQGIPVAIVVPETWRSAMLTFQLSGDGQFYGDLFDLAAKEISFNINPGTVVRVDPELNRGAAFVKFRSGTRLTPIKQSVQQDFRLFLDRPLQPLGLNEFAYVEAINDISIDNTRKPLLQAPSGIFDGVMACYVEFFAPALEVPANTSVKIFMTGGNGDIEFGTAVSTITGNTTTSPSCSIRRRLIPPVGPHAFVISAQRITGTGNVIMRAGAGGNQWMPAFLRVVTIIAG